MEAKDLLLCDKGTEREVGAFCEEQVNLMLSMHYEYTLPLFYVGNAK